MLRPRNKFFENLYWSIASSLVFTCRSSDRTPNKESTVCIILQKADGFILYIPSASLVLNEPKALKYRKVSLASVLTASGIYRLYKTTPSPSRGLRAPCPPGFTLEGLTQRAPPRRRLSHLMRYVKSD